MKTKPRLTVLLESPRRFVVVCIFLLVVITWLYMGYMAANMSESSGFTALGPGMSVFDRLSSSLQPEVLSVTQMLLNHGAAEHTHLMPGALGFWSLKDLFLTFIMWQLMAIGMMLPTATPTILAFHDISANDVQGRALKRRDLLFVLGYLNLWTLFSLAATALIWSLRSLSLLSTELISLNLYLSASVLLLAGVYQFTPLKEHCLSKCRNPLAFFFSSWRSGDKGALAMGAHHAIYCLGCCWALMLVMLVVGSMNLIWMAILGSMMLLEKVIPKGSKTLAYGTGALSCLAAIVLLIGGLS